MVAEPARPAAPLILVVEDNPANLLLTRAILHRAGYRTAAASSAEEALVFLAATAPALIVTDVQLPGKDGLTLTHEICANPATAHIPVVALTANAMRGDAERCLAAGCAAYLTKPVEARALIEALARHMPAPGGSGR